MTSQEEAAAAAAVDMDMDMDMDMKVGVPISVQGKGGLAEEGSTESAESTLSVSATPGSHSFFSDKSASAASEAPLSAPVLQATAAAAAEASSDLQWSFEALPDDFDKSPEPLPLPPLTGLQQQLENQPHVHQHQHHHHQLHLMQIRESSEVQEEEEDATLGLSPARSMPAMSGHQQELEHEHRHGANAFLGGADANVYFTPQYASTRFFWAVSKRIFQKEEFAVATWIGFWSLLVVTMGVSTITPIRDAVALQVGVQHMPKLTLASSVMAFLSSVPIGWLFEAPDPSRRKLWKKMGLTRGETQGSSLALFYRFFALSVTSYAIGFTLVDLVNTNRISVSYFSAFFSEAQSESQDLKDTNTLKSILREWIPAILTKLGATMYIAFFLVVHLMKLHSISLVWGVTTEAMEYEDVARKAKEHKHQHHKPHAQQTPAKIRTRLQRLAMVGFGGTLGGIMGSILASELVNLVQLPGLLLISAVLLEISAQLSVELGRIMQKHWEEQQIFKSTQDLASLDPSMKRSTSLGSMKRVASGNSLMKRVASGNSINQSNSTKSLTSLDSQHQHLPGQTQNNDQPVEVDDNTFTQRLLRGIKTILKSRLLMAIFTYNALFASTTVLLSFQRAELVANRNPNATTVAADTAFLAKINMASSIAVFTMQASGIGATIAHQLGPQGSLAIMPVIRLMGVLSLAWWHRFSHGQPPNLILFLMLDECTRVVNLAVAKPVRESLWRGLSNEARYEAKPIVDTLGNRWGAGSASFCVSAVHRILLWLGEPDAAADGEIAGLPPIIFLCLLVAVWWAMVSLDLGHVRRRIDLELKKRQ